MLAVASAIFFGAFLSAPYGLIPLVGAAGNAYAAWRTVGDPDMSG
jgi:hypothetical protein